MKRAEYFSSLPSSSSFFNTPSHTSIDAHSWLVAEQSVQRILSTIQPTVASEHRRNEVIGYLQNIIREYFGTEVLPFGSVPLKTYLPDGDIDLTVVCRQSTVEDLTGYICSFLEREGKKDTEFVIKKVEYIHAQVRLVKCVVQDIAVDISFNQIAGLSALCFLERVDQFIGRDHLFKRSIILIKAWCHYESRILGALHGLISTYALDLLVLHIINLFHSSIDGPFSVLFRFLDYYSTFDWKKYCVSLNGPVSISSLPEIMVGAPQNDGSDLLLSKEFLKNETDIFSVSTWELETSEQAFPLKHLNIIDPLKDNNNLGRSVCQENLYSQGIGTYIPIMESRGTGMFIPNIRIEEKMPQARCIVGMDVEDKVKSEGRFIPDKGVKEKGKMSLGRAICISGMDVEGKVKSIGAETFISNKGVEEMKIPNMDVEEMNKSQGSVTKILDVGVEEKSQPGGTATYILNVGINKNGESQGSGIYNHYVGVEGNTKSQGKGKHSSELVYQPGGTATYILNVGINKNAESQGSGIDNHYVGVEGNTKSQGKGKHSSELERESPKKQMHIWEREIDAGQKTLGLMPKSSLKNEHVNVLSETEDSCGCIDLSQEDLPHLSATKKTIPSKAPQPDQATIESSQAKKSSHLSKRVEFGFFGPSLPPLILSSPMADSEQPESSEHKEDRIPVQPYRLTDEKDFPPLSR